MGVWIFVVVKWFSGGVTADFGALKSRSHGDATEIEQSAAVPTCKSDRREFRPTRSQDLNSPGDFFQTPFRIHYASHVAIIHYPKHPKTYQCYKGFSLALAPSLMPNISAIELRDLRDCVCEIGSGSERIVHLAANVRLILFLTCRRRFIGRFAELCAALHGRTTDWR